MLDKADMISGAQEVDARKLTQARIRNLRELYKKGGIGPVLGKILRHIRNWTHGKKYYRFVKGLDGRSPATIFSEIYNRKLWVSDESRSGFGSELAYTEN